LAASPPRIEANDARRAKASAVVPGLDSQQARLLGQA
jgi:hypothetical protein